MQITAAELVAIYPQLLALVTPLVSAQWGAVFGQLGTLIASQPEAAAAAVTLLLMWIAQAPQALVELANALVESAKTATAAIAAFKAKL